MMFLKFFNKTNVILCVKKYSKPKSWELCFIGYFICIFRTSSLEGSVSSNLKRTFLGRQREESSYIEILQSLRVLFVPSKNLFPQSCLSSECSMVGLMVTSYKRVYVIPRSTVCRAPAPWSRPLLTCTSAGHTQTQFFLVSVDFLGPGVHRFCLSLPSISGRYGVWF